MKTVRIDVIIDFEYFDDYEFMADLKDFLRDRDAKLRLKSPTVEIDDLDLYLGL